MRYASRLFSMIAGFFMVGFAQAITVPDYAVQVSAAVQENPPRITLAWPADTKSTAYILYRKTRDAANWGSGTALATNATGYIDSNIVVGQTYEYQIHKNAKESTNAYIGYGYIYAGIQAPLVESRGKLILLVDMTMTNALAAELSRLQLDLVGDGWTVIRHDVSRTATPPQIKQVITNEYKADPANVKSVFILGHVPVPYSGLLNPDGHPDHLGAWPADVYYGDMTGNWTDVTANYSAASRVENRNVPGDGKFDQTTMPALLKLQVGRVDLWNMPAFPQSETELLRQYLCKDHNFRLRYINPQRRGLVSDNFGAFSGESFAVNSYRNFSPFFGYTNIVSGPWFSVLSSNSFLWGYGCGAGSYTSEGGVGSASDFATTNTQVIFTMHFGSYFGDFDAQNDFLRAQLGNAAGGLTCVWAGRPHWQFHHMAMGETIGFSAMTTENYSGNLYDANYGARWVHMNLMGDPTLRMHVVAPPSALIVADQGASGRVLQWRSSPGAVLGYMVYGAASADAPFTRLNTSLVTDTNYADLGNSSIYMVRAVKLETSASGTYTNISQGIFENLSGSFGLPSLVMKPLAGGTTFTEGTPIVVKVDTSDANNDLVQVDYFTNGVLFVSMTNWPYTLTWSDARPGQYALTVVARDLAGLTATSSPVNLVVNPDYSPPTVSWSGLISGATLTAGTVTLNVNANKPGGTTATVEYFLDGASIGQSTNAPYSLVWSNAPGGYHHLQARISASNGTSASTTNLFVSILDLPVTLVNSGAAWKYWDRGQNPGAGWNTLAFDDSLWPSGPSPLGYGDANGIWPATTNSYGPNANDKYITTYYRRAFLSSNTSGWTNLLMRIQRDDGALIYLNGTEVYRNNMPAGAVGYATLASATVGGTDETAWYLTNVNAALVLNGTNLLAAEIHQSTNNSSDVFFNLIWTAQPALAPPALMIGSSAQNLQFTWPAWAAALSLWAATNLAPPITWTQVTTNVITNSSQINITVPMDQQNGRFFQLRSW